jgi:hypothetical protein
MVILKKLIQVSSVTRIKIAIRFHGGGGVSVESHLSRVAANRDR